MLNRSLTPEIKPTQKIHFIEPQKIHIAGQAELFFMNKVPDETVRIEIHFLAGQIHGKKNMSSFVSSLLLSGTKDKKSAQIHEELNELGAYVDQEISMEIAFLNLFCLRKNAKKALEILIDALKNVNFPEHEISDLVQEKRQNFLISNEKVGYLSRREFQKQLFASSTIYSRQVDLEDYDTLSREDLIEFHKQFYLKGLKKIVVVGDLEMDFIDFLKENLADLAIKDKFSFENTFKNKAGEFHIDKKGAVQTAIRMGMPLFNKKSVDFFDFQVLQTILGDYFGSRLMSNIREDKGYTYGIGCGLVELMETGYFVIATEVGKDVTTETLKEIKFEIERLKTELVSEEELSLVKNYLLGQILKSADGANAMMDLFLGVEQHHLTLDFYNSFIEKIKNIRAEEIKTMANTYLDWSKFTIVTAGERN
ncbi:MAG: insulinase family protein [Bacteroidota bacterium]